jgi:hypothetical protein
MPDKPVNLPTDPDYQVAEELSARLAAAQCDYALGDAIAPMADNRQALFLSLEFRHEA